MTHLERLALLTEKLRRRREARKTLFECLTARTELKLWTQKLSKRNRTPSSPPESCDS